MKATARVFRFEFLRNAAKKSYLFFTLGVPLIALVLFFGSRVYQDTQSKAPRQAPVVTQPAPLKGINLSISSKSGVVDLNGLLSRLRSVAPFVRYATIRDANAALKDGQVDSYYVVPADYVETGKLELWMNHPSLMASGGSIGQLLTQALSVQIGVTDPAVFARLTQRIPTVTNHVLTETNQIRESAREGESFGLVYGFALLFMVGVFLTSGLLMQSVVEEKENRIVEVLMSSLRPWQLLSGKVLALGLLGLFQVGLWGGTAIFILGKLASSLPGLGSMQISSVQMGLLLTYYILGYLMFAAVYAGVGALSNSMREGPQLAAFFTLPALIPLYLTANFAAQPDSPLAVGLSIFPITAPLAMVMRLTISTVPTWQLVVSLTLLVITVIAFLWMAGRIFRIMVMLAGQTPKIRDLPRLIRQSN